MLGICKGLSKYTNTCARNPTWMQHNALWRLLTQSFGRRDLCGSVGVEIWGRCSLCLASAEPPLLPCCGGPCATRQSCRARAILESLCTTSNDLSAFLYWCCAALKALGANTGAGSRCVCHDELGCFANLALCLHRDGWKLPVVCWDPAIQLWGQAGLGSCHCGSNGQQVPLGTDSPYGQNCCGIWWDSRWKMPASTTKHNSTHSLDPVLFWGTAAAWQVRYTLGAKHEVGAWLSFLHIPDSFMVHTTDWWCLLPSELSCMGLTGPSLLCVTQLEISFLSLLPPFFWISLLASVIGGTKFTQQN